MQIEVIIPKEQSPLIQPTKPDAVLSLLETILVEIVLFHLMPILSPEEYGLLRQCSTHLNQIREKQLESQLTTSIFQKIYG
jgi:tyrosine-protein phosphatase YwqE